LQLHQQDFDISVIHGDGTTTVAKKGGVIVPDSAGNKHLKGDKVVPFCDRNCNDRSFVAAQAT